MSRSRLITCTTAGDATGADAAMAAIAVAAVSAGPDAESALLVDLRPTSRPPRRTLLASAAARGLEGAAVGAFGLRAAARGRICFAAPRDEDRGITELVAELAGPQQPAPLVACICEPADFRAVLTAAPGEERAALVRALPGADRSLLALLVAELHA